MGVWVVRGQHRGPVQRASRVARDTQSTRLDSTLLPLQAGNFTDTSSFTIRCLVCQCGLTGQAEAVAHAKASGHTNFSEFK